ncbi:hypothetical protein [Paenibacillus sp.]|uniref:hypothetical protein n=1 Tax=Paenibacillus sp. TaxID=58172 RepID=UPI0028A5F62D|nr:hypothetical protein [Paenibacillus sp.]
MSLWACTGWKIQVRDDTLVTEARSFEMYQNKPIGCQTAGTSPIGLFLYKEDL